MEKLTNERIADIARKNQIDPAALLAVKEVESNGGGFLPMVNLRFYSKDISSTEYYLNQ